MFRQNFTCSAVLFLARLIDNFDYETFTLFGLPSQSNSSIINLSRRYVGLFRVRSSLLTESLLLSFPTGTKIFQFPAYCLFRYQAFYLVGSPIRIPTDRRILTSPRSVSPLVASFIAF